MQIVLVVVIEASQQDIVPPAVWFGEASLPVRR
jgi:hypothetical protein